LSEGEGEEDGGDAERTIGRYKRGQWKYRLAAYKQNYSHKGGGAGGPYRNVALVSKQKQMFDPIASRFRACFKRSSPLILLQNNYSCFKESKKRKVFFF